MLIVDAVIGLQYGDEAKAKCTYSLIRTGSYSYVFRFNGGPNAGHTIYHKGKKIVTHQVPAGVFFGIPSIIGPGSVVDLEKLQIECEELREFLERDISDLVMIDYRAHIITKEHREKDSNGSIIGTTKSGVGYAYSDKAQRIGKRFKDFSSPFRKIDTLEILKEEGEAIFEGAQGFGLDIDFGDYPYVTSSHCGISGVICSGVRPDQIRNVFGIGKVYETYVGEKIFEDPLDSVLTSIQELGQEFGATTGRRRQCNYLDLDKLITACRVNQVTAIILNKMDILKEIGIYRCYYKGILKTFMTKKEFTSYIERKLEKKLKMEIAIVYSSNPNEI
jgi:adenylosuccinate synthase